MPITGLRNKAGDLVSVYAPSGVGQNVVGISGTANSTPFTSGTEMVTVTCDQPVFIKLGPDAAGIYNGGLMLPAWAMRDVSLMRSNNSLASNLVFAKGGSVNANVWIAEMQ